MKPQILFALLVTLLIAAEPTEGQKNAKAQADLARTVYEGMIKRYQAGDFPFDIEKFSLWSHRWASAQRDSLGTFDKENGEGQHFNQVRSGRGRISST